MLEYNDIKELLKIKIEIEKSFKEGFEKLEKLFKKYEKKFKKECEIIDKDKKI